KRGYLGIEEEKKAAGADVDSDVPLARQARGTLDVNEHKRGGLTRPPGEKAPAKRIARAGVDHDYLGRRIRNRQQRIENDFDLSPPVGRSDDQRTVLQGGPATGRRAPAGQLDRRDARDRR